MTNHKYLRRGALALSGVAVASTLLFGGLLWLRVAMGTGTLPPPLLALVVQVRVVGGHELAVALLSLAHSDGPFFRVLWAQLATLALSGTGAVWLAMRASTCGPEVRR